MENNWPETVEELMAECQMLVSKTDLYELGERGEPFTGESEPRVDGTDYLAGEYQYGVAMIPAQWVTHVIDAATVGCGECTPHGKWESISQTQEVRHVFCECGYELGMDERDLWPFRSTRLFAMPNYCQECGRRIRKRVVER